MTARLAREPNYQLTRLSPNPFSLVDFRPAGPFAKEPLNHGGYRHHTSYYRHAFRDALTEMPLTCAPMHANPVVINDMIFPHHMAVNGSGLCVQALLWSVEMRDEWPRGKGVTRL